MEAPEGSVRPNPSAMPSLIVGIGASAGGLEACQRFLAGAPDGAGVAYILVLHLAPASESHVAEILQRGTRLRVTQVGGNERIEPDRLYVIAPATSLSIRDGVLVSSAPVEPHYLARPVDAFFAALAQDQKERAVGIVLSGTGNDGSAGLEAIRSAGGLGLVQDPGTADFNGMPESAVATGTADSMVAPEAMGAILLRFAEVPSLRPPAEGADPQPGSDASSDSSSILPEILALLGKRYRVDFRDYKIGTLKRRTERRIENQRLDGWGSYRDFLQSHPDEVKELYNDFLIGVTSFFRDPDEWEDCTRDVIPELIRLAPEGTEVRLWSAGCATGEEAYGLAIVLLERFEAAGLRRNLKVFASDASEEALAVARKGYYPAAIADHVSPERLRRFFHRSGDGYEIDRSLREVVTFATHDLLSDPPFARLDLVSCRNLLIYLESAAQERLMDLFHFALRPEGTLWLGSSETIGRRTDLFESRGKHRFYRSLHVSGPGRHRFIRRKPDVGQKSAALAPSAVIAAVVPSAPGEAAKARLLEKMVLYRHTKPCVVIDKSLEILYSFGKTEDYLTRPLGETRSDLLSWVRPELYAKLRGALAEAVEQAREITVSGMRIERDGETFLVEVVIEPVASTPRSAGLFLVAFSDLPASRVPVPAATGAGEETEAYIAQLRQEIQDTREELRAAVEQLRIATEEHSGSFEEVLSLNEEFQVSNEELEASKEELQSLNEELTTINRQLEERNEELHVLTSDLNNLLVSAKVPTIFLDQSLRIRRFTPACDTLMRIVPADLGRSISDIKMQLLDERLLEDAQNVLADRVPIEVEISSEDGRWFLRRVLPYRTEDGAVTGVCLTFHEITQLKQANAASEYARLYAEAIIRTSRTPLLVLGLDYRIVSANAAFYSTYPMEGLEGEGRSFLEVGDGRWDIPPIRTVLEKTLVQGEEVLDYDIDHLFANGWRCLRLNSHVLRRDERPDLLLLSIEDVTDLRRAELQAEGRVQALEQGDQRKNEFLAMLGHELRNPLSALANGLELLSLGGEDSIEPTRAMMERQTKRMVAMLDQLLDVARVISGKFELAQDAVDIRKVAQDAIESVNLLLQTSGQTFSYSLPAPGTVHVLGDSIRLSQVIENLLGNAAKYSPPGGRITLQIDASETEIRISVCDTGIGLEASLLEGIFDLFTQAPNSLQRAKGGLGLGLALVRNLAQVHGGSVEAFSAGLGTGSEFVVRLPRLRPGWSAKPSWKKIAPESIARRILVVDDEIDSSRTLVGLLKRNGHDTRAVEDGATALAVVGAFRPDVVFIDLGLPAMDGYKLAAQLGEVLDGRVKLIALTGYQSDEERLLEAGFDAHLLKPVSLERMLALIVELTAGLH